MTKKQKDMLMRLWPKLVLIGVASFLMFFLLPVFLCSVDGDEAPTPASCFILILDALPLILLMVSTFVILTLLLIWGIYFSFGLEEFIKEKTAKKRWITEYAHIIVGVGGFIITVVVCFLMILGSK